MTFSARTLVVALICSSFLGGCFNKSEKQEWAIEPDGQQSTFAIPQKVSNKVELANLSARVRLDNGDWQALIIANGAASGRMDNIEEGAHFITVQFVYNDARYGQLVLAETLKAITITAGQRTRLELADNDYDLSFDNDEDGISNADELDQDTDPTDPMDPPPASSSVSSASEASSLSSELPASSSSLAVSSSSAVSSSELSSSSVVAGSSSSNGNIVVIPDLLANAGADLTVQEGAAFQLVGQALNASAPVTYSWRFVGTQPLTLEGAASPTLTVTTGNYLADQLFTFELTVTQGNESHTDAVDVTVKADNEVPVVSFIPAERTVAPNTLVELTPFEHKDPEAQPLTYSWAQLATDAVQVDDFNFDNETATFTTPGLSSADETLELNFELTVSDGVNSTAAPVKVIVQDRNDTPVAQITAANAATSVAENTTLVLSGASSTDKYTSAANLGYQWELESDGAFDLGITDWTTQTITVVAPNLAEDHDLRFSLVVTDDSIPALSSSKVFFNLTITADNEPAVVTIARPSVAQPGATVSLVSSITDPDFEHQNLTYTYTWSDPADYDGLLDSLNAANATFTAPAGLMTTTDLTFGLQVTQVGEGALAVAPTSVIATVSEGYVAPTALAALVAPMTPAREAVAFELTAAGSSAGSQDIASYSWSTDCTDGSLANANAVLATFTPANRLDSYDCTFTLTVADAATPVGSSANPLVVTINATDEAPTLITPTPLTGITGSTQALDASESADPEGQVLSFSWSTNEADIVLTDADTAVASFTVPAVEEATSFTFTVTASDGNANNIQTQDVIVQVAGSNTVPTAVITPVDGGLVAEASTVELDGSASNDDFTESADLIYQWRLITTTTYALGITDFTQSTLSFNTPNLAEPITLEFELVVTDAQGEASAPVTYTVTVDAANALPAVTVQPNPVTVEAEAEVTLTALVTNADEDQAAIDYTYVWTAPIGYESLVAGVTGATLTFTAPAIMVASQTLDFTVVATEDVTGGESSAVVTASVIVLQGYVPPSASAALVGGGTTLEEGVAATLTAAGSVAGTNQIAGYDWATTCAGQLSNATTEVASFTATNTLASQDCDFTLTVSDGEIGGTNTVVLAVTVNAANDAPVATAPAAQINANAGMPIALSGITVEDLDTPTLSYSWTSTNTAALALLGSTTELAPTFTPASAPEEALIIFTLTVIDGGEAGRTAAQNAVSVASIDVLVAANNDVPQADIALIMPASVTDIAEKAGVTLNAVPKAGNMAIDRFTAANDLTYTWTPNAALSALGIVADSGQGKDQFSFAFSDLEAPAAELAVTLVIEDAQGATSTAVSFPFSIKADNAAPDLTLNAPVAVNGGDTISFEAIAADPEALRALTYSWQQLDADGSALAANDPAAVVCSEGNTTNICSFIAPTSNDDQSIRFEVTVAEAGSEDFLKESTANKAVNVTSGYIAPVLALALEAGVAEGDPATITANLTTTGTATISNYDWSGSTCLGQPVLEDFSTVTGETLTFITPAQQKSGYTCDITLIATDSTNAAIVVPALVVNVSAEDDLPVAQIENRILSISGSDLDDPSDELLDGSPSYDEENDTLYYRWSQDPADAVQVTWSSTGETDGRAFFSVPQQANEVTLNFSLTVCDAENNPLRCDTTPESIAITVTASNQAPIVIISVNDAEVVGADDDSGRITVQETNHPAQRAVDEGEVEVTISAALSSDPAPSDGQLTYSWSLAGNQGGGTTIELGSYANVTAWAEGELGLTAEDWTAESLTFITPNFAEDRDLLFTLTVSDGELNVSKDLILTVAADNDAPVVILLNPGVDNFPLSSAVGTRIGFTAEDPEGAVLSYEWRSADGYPDGTLFLSSITETTPLFTAPAVLSDTTYGLYPLVADAQGAVAENVGVIEIQVASSDTQNPIASAVLETTPLLDNAVGAEIRSTSTDDTGIASYLWSSSNSEITFTTNDQAVGIFDVSGMPATGVATITLTVTDAAGKTDSIDVPVTIEASYTPWALALEVTSPLPADPAFDAIEEQDEIVITAQVVTQGTNAIAQYDWSDSTCSYTAPSGQPLTNPAVADFSLFSDSSTLTFSPITFVFSSYACVIKLTALDGEGAPVNTEISINIFADNDPAVAIAGALIGGVETEVESLTVKANDVISLISIEASDSDTQLRQGDIYWEIVEPEYAGLFVFSSNLQRNTDLTIPLIPGGAEVTVRLNVGGVFDEIQLVVEPQPISAEIKIAPEEIFDASFAFELEARVTGATADTNFEWVASKASWGPGHENITFENVQLSADGTTVTAKMRVSVEALNGIDRSSRDVDDNNVRTVALDLQVDGNTVLTEPSEMRIVLPFVTVWDTTATTYNRGDGSGPSSGTSSNELLITTHPDYIYDYHVDWGDGNFEENITGDRRHSYSVEGAKTVKIIGDFPSLRQLSSVTDVEGIKLKHVYLWGDTQWQSMNYFCYFCVNLQGIDAPDKPDLSLVKDMSFMFTFAYVFNDDIGQWDVSGVQNMSYMFLGANQFNQDLSSWNVKSVTDFGLMFYDTENFNGDISTWNTENARNMAQMFESSGFNGDVGSWDTSSVLSMARMFENAVSFDQDLSAWEMSAIEDMQSMFRGVKLSTQNYDALLAGWSSQLDTSLNVTFNAGDSQYTVAAASARAELERKGWTITDGGMVPIVEVRPHELMEGDVSKGFVIAPLPDAPVITNYDWSQSTCPDGSGGTLAILENVTGDTSGSVTITPPNFGSDPFVCDIVVELTLNDGALITFNHPLTVTPLRLSFRDDSELPLTEIKMFVGDSPTEVLVDNLDAVTQMFNLSGCNSITGTQPFAANHIRINAGTIDEQCELHVVNRADFSVMARLPLSVESYQGPLADTLASTVHVMSPFPARKGLVDHSVQSSRFLSVKTIDNGIALMPDLANKRALLVDVRNTSAPFVAHAYTRPAIEANLDSVDLKDGKFYAVWRNSGSDADFIEVIDLANQPFSLPNGNITSFDSIAYNNYPDNTIVKDGKLFSAAHESSAIFVYDTVTGVSGSFPIASWVSSQFFFVEENLVLYTHPPAPTDGTLVSIGDTNIGAGDITDSIVTNVGIEAFGNNAFFSVVDSKALLVREYIGGQFLSELLVNLLPAGDIREFDSEAIANNNYLYVAGSRATGTNLRPRYLFKFDISDLANIKLIGEYGVATDNLTPFVPQGLYQDTVVSAGGPSNVAVYDTQASLRVLGKEHDLVGGQSHLYQIEWDEFATDPASLDCVATIGDCSVPIETIDFVQRTATAVWDLPSVTSVEQHEIQIIIGGDNFMTSDFDRVSISSN